MRVLIFCFLHLLIMPVFTQQDVGFELFYCEQTLSDTYIKDVDTEPILMEIPLNASAAISKLALFHVLKPDVSLFNISALPVNFASTQSYGFKLKKGNVERDVIMRARQIKSRSGAFNINFVNNYKPADWSLFTTGWMVVGVDQDATDVSLNHDNATFFMAGDGIQDFLTFDLVDDGSSFDGVLVVEGSVNGVNNWDPVYVLDNCAGIPVEKGHTIRLRLPKPTRFIRIGFQKHSAVSSGVRLNNFHLKLYDGGEYDNKTNVSIVRGDERIQIFSTIVQHEIRLLHVEKLFGKNYAIYATDGRICQSGQINDPVISVDKLANGIYMMKVNDTSQAVKFINK